MSCTSTYLNSPEFLTISLHLLTFISTPVYCLGIYCILFKTPSPMKSTKWYLLSLQLSITLFDYSMTLLLVPFVLAPEAAAIFYGGLRSLKLPVSVGVLPVFLLCCVCFSTLSVFEHRFFIVCEFRVKKYWTWMRRPWLAGHYLVNIAAYIPIIYSIPDQEDAKKMVFQNLPCLPQSLRSDPLLVMASDITYAVIVCVLGGVSYVAELIFFITSMVLSGRARTRSLRMSQKTYQMHKQFFIALVIQTTIPSSMLFVPMAYIYAATIRSYHNQAINNMCVISLTFHGLLATVVMLIVHQPYRIAIRDMIRKREQTSESSNVVSLAPRTR